MFISERKRRPGKCSKPLRAGGDLLAEGPSVRSISPDARKPFHGRERAMFLHERNFSLTSQRRRRPRKCPRPLRAGGDLLAEGPSTRLIFSDGRMPFPAQTRAMFLFGRKFSLTSQRKLRPRKCTQPLRVGGDLLAEGRSARLMFPDAIRPFPGRARVMFLPERNSP